MIFDIMDYVGTQEHGWAKLLMLLGTWGLRGINRRNSDVSISFD